MAIIRDISVHAHLLGKVAFADCQRLQDRLEFEAVDNQSFRITVLLAEHSPLITVGRNGSRGHVLLTDQQLRREQLELRWVSRGGGCVLHSHGQIAVYVICHVGRLGWSVGNYLSRVRRALVRTCEQFRIQILARPERGFGVWARSGQIATLGVAIRRDVTSYGAFLNVNPPMRLFSFVRPAVPMHDLTSQSSLMSERRQGVKMTAVRVELVEQLSHVFGSEQCHLQTGHPYLRNQMR
ncbi:MAG: hypothetical protein VX346_26880 [Planctomycetota bacterium]|nr:hypothetical protein [Planctomycetota bacterium]